MEGGRGSERRRSERGSELAARRLLSGKPDTDGAQTGLRVPEQRRHLHHQSLPVQRLPAAHVDLPAVLQEGSGHQTAGLQKRVRRDLRRLPG